jgi:flagellin
MALTIDSGFASQLSGGISEAFGNLARSLSRLSSGERITTPADDPAGLALASTLRTQSRVLQQARRNADDAVNMLQTADGAMATIDEKLIGMKELAEQSSTGTYTTAQRTIMNSEFAAMGAEIDRLANATEFNGKKLLNGSLSATGSRTSDGGWREPTGSMTVQVDDGANPEEDNIPVTIPDVRTTALFGGSTPSIATQTSAETALGAVDSAIVRKDSARAWVGAQQTRLEDVVDNLDARTGVLDEAVSDIMDVDFATELTDYTANLVRAQASVAMVVQANTLPKLVTTLLDGL